MMNYLRASNNNNFNIPKITREINIGGTCLPFHRVPVDVARVFIKLILLTTDKESKESL